MRWKYIISKDITKNILKIREYAIIAKNLNKVSSSISHKEHYSFLCEEIYKSDMIIHFISEGMNILITILRTKNMFPIESYAVKIAESVVVLYSTPDSGSVELSFDNVEFNTANIETFE